MAEWREYQEEVAAFFRSLGLSAETDVATQGVRTSHNVDVVVRSQHAGFDVLWLVECKSWKTAVPKEKVLALRSIVEDIGADRGLIMAENGYQSGALEASRFANIVLTSIAALRETLGFELGTVRLNTIVRRVESYRVRYWAISKQERIALGLRTDAEPGYSGATVINAVANTARHAMLAGFPIAYERMLASIAHLSGWYDPQETASGVRMCHTPSELCEVLDAELHELELRLEAAEASLASR